MNSYMTIYVRVVSSQAQAKMAAVAASTQAVAKSAQTAAATQVITNRSISNLGKWGNQLQWAGRQLQYNFTLPLGIAGIAATKWAMENEKAFTRVKKVYGDTQAAAKQFMKENKNLTEEMATQKATKIFAGELNALNDAFVEISNTYGVQQKEVMEVAAAWAAAGASGRALAEDVNLTMKAMILGELDSKSATEALIAIQAQYNLNSKELTETLAYLNATENATGATMGDLIIGFQKVAGVAKEAGIDTRHLAAFMAALVPATGSAATAGNALKTILSRLQAPTTDTVDILHELGINIDSVGWQAATGGEKLEILAEKFNDLSDAQKNQVSSVIASRWQLNKFNILMDELGPTFSFYEAALSATHDRTKAFAIMQKELNAVLQSSPQRLQQTWVILQNALADAIIPAIPYILYLAQSIADLAQAFADLDPQAQKLILFGLAFVAVSAIVIRYVGVLALGIDLLRRFLTFGAGAFAMFGLEAGAAGVAAEKTAGGVVKLLKVLTITPIVAFSQALGAAFGAISGWIASALLVGRNLFLAWFPQVALIFSTGLADLAAYWTKFTAFLVTTWIRMQFALGVVMSGSKTFLVGIWTRLNAALVAILNLSTISMRGVWTRFLIWMAKAWALAWAFMTNPRLLLAGLARLLPIIVAFGRGIIAAVTGPWGIAIMIVLGILYTFREQIAQIWNNIVDYFSSNQGIVDFFQGVADAIIRAFYALPQGVQNALIAVARVVQQAVLEIYGWLQYLNPFATHSPSLVQNVTQGVDEIKRQFGTLTSIQGPISVATAALQRFNKATANISISAKNLEIAQQRAEIKRLDPGALASYDDLISKTRMLENVLGRLQNRLDAQQGVVDRWQAAVDRATAALERQQNKLDRLNDTLSNYQDKLSEAQERLDYFANAPLKGMDAMEDKIFRNEMAQKRLRLEMMKMEDAKGTLEDINQKLADINGEQELLRGERTGLRMAGAGSEILGQYDDELKKLGNQETQYEKNADALTKMQLKLDALGRQAEKLDLVKSLKFDVLQHKIEEMVDTSKELTFQQIVNGIKKARHQVEFYTKKVDQASNAVDHQQNVVDRATKHRDKLQNRLDREQKQLERIQKRYDAVNDALQSMNTALQDITSAAQTLNDVLTKDAFAAAKGPLSVSEATKALADAKKADKATSAAELSPAVKAFRAAGKGDFPDVGGKGSPLRKDWRSQVPSIEDFTQQLSDEMTTAFADINPFAGWKEKAASAFSWIGDKASTVASAVGGFFSAAFSGVSFSKGQKEGFSGTLEWFKKFMEDVKTVLVDAWKLFGPEIKQTIRNIVHAIIVVWKELGPQLAKFGELMRPLGQALKNAWIVIKPILGLLLILMGAVIKVLWSLLNDTFMPVFEAITGALAGFLEVIRGTFRIALGVFNLFFDLMRGDWKAVGEDIKQILKGIWEIFHGTFKSIWSLIKGVVETVIGLVEGLVTGIFDFFKWLWDVLVGSSIIPDLIDKIIDLFGKILDPIKKVLGKLWDAFKWLMGKIGDAWDKIWGFFKDFWDKEKRGWQIVINFVQDKLGPVFSWLWKKIKEVWNDIWEKIDWAWGKIHGVWSAVVKYIKERFIPAAVLLWDKIKDMWDKIWGKTKDIWNNVIGKFKDVISYFKDKFGPALTWVWDKVKDMWDNVWTKTKDIWDKVWGKVSDVYDKLKTGIGNVRDAFRTVWDKIKDIFKGALGHVLGWFQNLADGFDKISGVVNGPEINYTAPKWAAAKGRVMPGYTPGRDVYDVKVSGGEAIMRPEWTRAVGKANVDWWNGIARRQGVSGVRKAMGTEGSFALGGVTNPMQKVYIDGEPLTAVHAAQIILAGRLQGRRQHVIQGSWQPWTPWSQTSHSGPGVADTSPGSFRAQYTMRRVAVAAWARNIPGAAQAGSGAHVHGVSMLSAPGNSQLAQYAAGGDGLGGRDYGARPPVIPNIREKIAKVLQMKLKKLIAGIGSTGTDFLAGAPAWVTSALTDPQHYFMELVNGLSWAMHSPLATQGKDLTKKIIEKMVDFAKGKLTDLANEIFQIRDPGAVNPIQLLGDLDSYEVNIIMAEAGGLNNVTANNPISSAYGLGQLIEANRIKYARQLGYNWQIERGDTGTTNRQHQIAMMRAYIRDRYGTSQNAWEYHLEHGVYGKGLSGGIFRKPTMITVGDRGPERVDVTPLDWRDGGRGVRRSHTVNINGNLEFPNISDPNDAERFIKNLEALAG